MLNHRIIRKLNRGLEQYLWFLGQDTRDRKCNLLEEYGFHRYRTLFHGGSSRYQIPWGLKTVELHSYCVGIYGGEEGFIFIRAQDSGFLYLGKLAPVPGRYNKKFLATPSNEESKRRFYSASCEFLQWLEHYESWVEANCGKKYRQDCYGRYHRKWLEPDAAHDFFNRYRFDLEGLKLQNENLKRDKRVRAA